MVDKRDQIQRMFDPPQRFNAFGETLMRMHIYGIRCHSNTFIEFESPITAISGINGTGKSTVLQLAAAAYKNEDPRGFTIRDFIASGALDPAPFRNDAAIEYSFWNAERGLTPRTISRDDKNKKWNGYERRFTRPVLFTSIGQYLPRIEQHDFIVSKAEKLRIIGTKPVPEEVSRWVCNILSCNYQDIKINQVEYSEGKSRKAGEVITVERSGQSYSESHMGFGEGRTLYLISAIEGMPAKSLILIEEPETSLHPSAQYHLGLYLIDVVVRKHHQIILTTHSPFILNSLPTESRIFLRRLSDRVDVLPRLASSQIRSLLADGSEKALMILVEDDCAQAILRELIRKIDNNLLQVVDIQLAGGAESIVPTVKAMKDKMPVIAVLDSDKKEDLPNSIFKLPGELLPPEKVLFRDPAIIQFVQGQYGLSLSDYAAGVSNLDHHAWLKFLANHVNQSYESVLGEFARVFANAHETEAYTLVQQIKDALK